jgi:hypothetical protein
MWRQCGCSRSRSGRRGASTSRWWLAASGIFPIWASWENLGRHCETVGEALRTITVYQQLNAHGGAP